MSPSAQSFAGLKRFCSEGAIGLIDRSSRPQHSPSQLPARKVEAIRALRKLRMTAAQIAEVLGLVLSTVSLWLKRIGLGKRSRREPPEPPNLRAPYQRAPELHLGAKHAHAKARALSVRTRAVAARRTRQCILSEVGTPSSDVRLDVSTGTT